VVSRGARPAILILSSAPSALAGGALAIAMGGGVLSLGSLGGLATSTVLSLFLLPPLILAFRYRERPHERA
jgi:Cu/Ag efflux pump CusA